MHKGRFYFAKCSCGRLNLSSLSKSFIEDSVENHKKREAQVKKEKKENKNIDKLK